MKFNGRGSGSVVKEQETGLGKDELIKVNRRWLEEKEADLAKKEEEIKRLQEECVIIKREMEPLEQWLEQLEGKPAQSISRQKAGMKKGQAGTGREENAAKIEKEIMVEELRGQRLRDEVVSILQEAYPEMLYYREILRRLKERGYMVAGENPGPNLIAHISKDERVKRGAKRGIYGLADAGTKEPES